MKTRSYLMALSLLTTLSFCSSPSKVSRSNVALLQSQASSRKQSVASVHYDLEFRFDPTSEHYWGQTTLNFDWTPSGAQNLRIDFDNGVVNSVLVNGLASKHHYDGESIALKTSQLNRGRNSITIVFKNKFSNDGAGLYRFLDPEDKRVYLYSNLQPYAANKVFPCFDQPDLRATYAMIVLAPETWEVITYARESKIESLEGLQRRWTFPKSEAFSTYIWSLHAGPYHVWTSSNKSKYPLRLFARQSLKSFVDPKFWFQITQQGFDYFERYFNHPYPYQKYDQLIVPDFNAGAMENVAAVTFTERYLSRGKMSRAEQRDLANVILHEMAHMWFGNLVTMKWWNELWLNESFATYMANKAMAAATTFKDEEAWRDFYDMKVWAYSEDSYVTTHPIESNVMSTRDAFTNFDGITYGKGASVLKQLNHLIGETSFRDGVRSYFQKHQGQNTTREDFMNALAVASRMNLDEWTQQWLTTSGVARIETHYECDSNNLIRDFHLTQSTPAVGDQIVRTQKLQIALYFEQNGLTGVGKQHSVMLKGHRTDVPNMNGLRCPAFVDSNHEDFGYGLFVPDERSLAYFQTHYQRLKSPFLRQRTWVTLWHEFRSGKLKFGTLANAVKLALVEEKDPVVIQTIAELTLGRRANSISLYSLWPKASSTDLTMLFAYAQSLEEILWNKLKKSLPESELQTIAFEAFLKASLTQYGLDRLKLLLDGKVSLRGLTIDQDKRWEMLQALARATDSEAAARIQSESSRDLSSRGQDAALIANAILSQPEFFQHWRKLWLQEPSTATYSQLRSLWTHLYPPLLEALRDSKTDVFFQDLERLSAHKTGPFLRAYIQSGPSACAKNDREKILSWLQTKTLDPAASKALRIRHQDGETCDLVRRHF